MTRVLFLAESFHPVLGGGEAHLRRLCGGLVAAGFEATVLTRRSEPSLPVEEWLDGVRVVRVPPSGPARAGKYAMVPAACARLLRERFDLLVVRGTRVLGLPGLLAARARRRPVVMQPEVNGEMSGEVYTWGTRLQGGAAGGLVREAVRLRNGLMLDAEAFVAMSRRIAAELREAGVPSERLWLIPHGVDCARFRPAGAEERLALRSALGLPRARILITFTGRLLRGKGLPDLVAALAALVPAEPRVHLVVVGSGAGQALSVEDELRAQVAQAGLLGQVTFTGRVEDVADHLRASDLFAFPSVFEALGLSLVEAAACGLACVGARTGGIVDVIEDGASGLLVPPGDRHALAEALGRLASDQALRERLGAGARRTALERFDERDSLRRYAALFRELHGRARLGTLVA